MTLSLNDLKQMDHVQWLLTKEHTSAFNTGRVTPWSADIIQEVDTLSSFILKHPTAKAHSEIIALAFWFRKANLLKIKQSYLDDPYKRQVFERGIGTGKVFHISPANVDTVFFYTLILGVLAGHQNLVKLSHRGGATLDRLVGLIGEFFSINPQSPLCPLIHLVQYSSEQSSVTESFSRWSDLRIIWGGDNTVKTVSEIAPQTKQLCFPDRYSVCVARLLNASDAKTFAKLFATDAVPFNQQACASPKAIYWLDTDSEYKNFFYLSLKGKAAAMSHEFTVSDHVSQHNTVQHLALGSEIDIDQVNFASPFGMVSLKNLQSHAVIANSGHGLVYETDLKTIDSLVFADKLQCIGVFGLNDSEQEFLRSALLNNRFKRLVCSGQMLTFEHIWDGIDLVSELSTVV